ncbi:phage tape measure protein [Methylorubrum populi BJ001]|uniref:Phage tape measure protein n=1 Tax=Methylorubrum populi (strain ATCC BAA-705 / NCIMB 13946 / BJ001) TaxID=441620 RepID=B1ZCD7_METPB|nr:tape measure protein [Methylorubrum populi]ACB80830.1 phage tape measure protein [Methylorubrum populi BJ001]
MTAVIGGISVFLEDDTARFQQSMTRNAALVEQQTARMTRSLGNTARSVDDLNRRAAGFQPDAFRALATSALRAETSIQRLRASMLAITALATGGFAGAFATKVVVDTADAYSNVQNKIAAVVDGQKERVAAEREIFEIAQRTRSGYETTATLFQRLTLSSSALKASQADILRVVETVQKSLITGGATTQEAAGAAVQLTQALGAGRLQGDELRSILENAPLLAQAIAREFGVAVGELKAMGSEGQLTSDRVFRALLKSGNEVEERFRQMKPTVAQSLVVLDNAFTRYIGQADQSLGATAALAAGIISLSENLHVLGDTAAVVAPLLAAVFAARMTGRGIAAVQAPFKEEFAQRDAALAQARAAEQAAGERLVSAGGQAAELRSRARSDIDSFADSDQLRNRERVRRAVEADAAALAKADAEYRSVAQKASTVDLTSITRSAEEIRNSKDLVEQRKALTGAQRELTRSSIELDRASGAAAPSGDDRRVRLQDRLNEAVSKEEVLRNRLHEAAIAEFRAREAAPGDVAAGGGRGLRDQLERAMRETASIRQRIVDEDQAASASIDERRQRAQDAYNAALSREEVTRNRIREQEIREFRRRSDGGSPDLAEAQRRSEFRQSQADQLERATRATAEARARLDSVEADVGTETGARRLRLQEQLTVAVERENAARGRFQDSRLGVQEQLNKAIASTTAIQEDLRKAEAEAAERVVAASGRVEEAKRKVAAADREMKTAVIDRMSIERGETNRGLMVQVADAAVARRNAAGQLDTSREILGLADQEVRQNAVANATKAVGAAQQQATIAAAGYRLAQEGVATAAARTGAAVTLLSTTMRLAQAGFGSLLAFLGGPLGAAFTAATVGLSLYALSQAKAAEAARDHADALSKLAARSKEVSDNAAKGKVLSDADTVRYRELQKGAFRSLNDERNTLLRLGQRLQSNSSYRDTSSPAGAAAQATGINLSNALVDVTTKPAASEEGRRALEQIRDLYVAIANVDPRFGKDADAAIDSYMRLKDGIKVVMDAQAALKASQATTPVFDSPFDRDLMRAPRFDGSAAKAAVESFVDSVKDSITELSETRIEFPGLSTSREQIADFATALGQARAEASGLVSQKVVPTDVYDAVAAFTAGKTTVEEYAMQLQELRNANPSFAPLIDSLAAATEKALSARATLQALGIDISKLDGMVANVVVKVGVSADGKEVSEAIAAEAAKGAKVVADLEAKTRNMRLRAEGKSVEASTNEIMARTPAADRAAVERNVREQEDLQKRISALGRKPKKEPKSEEEKFEDRLKRLTEEGRAAFFTDTDRALIEELKKIKGEPTLLRNTVDAIKAGAPLPQQAQQLREALVMRDAGKEYRTIIQAYGNAEQILPQVNAEQQKLNMLLAEGKITADQYGMALADSLSKYQNYRWIDQTADSVGNFAGELGEAALGFKSFDDVASSFLQTIVRLGVQIALVQPLINMLKSGLSSAAVGGGGGPLSFITSLFGGLSGGGGGGSFDAVNAGAVGSFEWLHEGGIAGAGSSTRTFPLSVLQGAPRFHKGNLGLGPDEIPAILQRGEPVLSRRTAKNLSNAIGTLSEMSGGGGEMTVNVHPPAGTTPQVQKKRTQTGQSADVFIRSVIGADLAGNGPLAQALQDMYGLNRMSGKQS